jgi:predicted ATPase
MIDLTVKNFAAFKGKTSFNISPLTFLIGANGSGKSSFLKLLNLIEHDFKFNDVDKFDLGTINFQLQDIRKPLEITYEVSNNLHKKIKVSLFKGEAGAELEDYISYNELSIIYLDEEGEEVLSTAPMFISDSFRGIKATLDVEKFYEILDKNNASEFKQKLELSSLPLKKVSLKLSIPNFWDPYYFENWLFSTGLHDFFSQISLDTFIIPNADLGEYLLPLFKPSFYTKKGQNLMYTSQIQKNIQLDIIRLNDLGEPKRMFTPEDEFGKTLKNLEFIMTYNSVHYGAKEFLAKWIEKFFGKNTKFTYKRENKEFYFYTSKLNNKFLTEQGTGVFRILHLICKLSTFYYSDSFLESLPKDIFDKTRLPFISKRFLVLEEPEANLHPDFQVKLAEMLYELSCNSTHNLIIETHSEYMIRMIQYLVAKNEGGHKQVGIMNFGSEENLGKVKFISVKPNGALSDNFFSGFFNYSEDLRLMLDALNFQRNN